ncbi:MAG: helix-turn-helix transcriptional regulator [Bacteroidetes bacterium]|nr:helix-turn-helix transcriptional regulator [Bacteroidota bacterium]
MAKKNYNRLKVILAEKETTNKVLAIKLKTTAATVSRWCTNDAQPSLEKLYQIADVLNVDVRDLLVPNKK